MFGTLVVKVAQPVGNQSESSIKLSTRDSSRPIRARGTSLDDVVDFFASNCPLRVSHEGI